jgi:hypothetical protein
MGGVVRQGGVSIGGGSQIGQPSPAGQWSFSYDNQTVDFDRDAFTRLLDDKGYDVLWEKGVVCPNVPRDGVAPRDHDINCHVCGGFEFVFVDPIKTRMLMHSIRLDQSFYAYGRWDLGQMMVTPLPEFKLNYWDRLTLLNGTARFTEHIFRQQDTKFDLLKYPALSLDFVVATDRARGRLIKYGVGDQVQLSEDGTAVQWLANPPDSGQRYSVAYTYAPRYVVLNLLHHHRDSTIDDAHYPFPVQAIAKLDFLVRDQSRDPAEARFKDPFPTKTP